MVQDRVRIDSLNPKEIADIEKKEQEQIKKDQQRDDDDNDDDIDDQAEKEAEAELGDGDYGEVVNQMNNEGDDEYDAYGADDEGPTIE